MGSMLRRHDQISRLAKDWQSGLSTEQPVVIFSKAVGCIEYLVATAKLIIPVRGQYIAVRAVTQRAYIAEIEESLNLWLFAVAVERASLVNAFTEIEVATFYLKVNFKGVCCQCRN